MSTNEPRDLTHDLLLPTLLFAALGGMTWAVRGCSGFGGEMGCIFAGVTWGTAWWFIAREPGSRQSRRYSSGWIILALTVGIGMAGARGWMQWPSFFNGRLMTDASAGKFVPIPRIYGFIWLFIAGMPWAGLGACLLAWCGSRRPFPAWLWAVRLGCGLGAMYLALILFRNLPEVFLPLYGPLKAQYQDFQSNPNLGRLVHDNRAAIQHLGLYLGFLLFEAGRRDWKGVKLILTVGVLNGLGWALCQNWQWAARLWPDAHFNFWRCWESSGGISIGIAYGVAYYVANNRMSEPELTAQGTGSDPNLERLGAYLGLLLGLGLSIKNGLKGWCNIYLGNEQYWNGVLWRIVGPLMALGLVAILLRVRLRPLPKPFQGDVFPHAYRLVWLTLLVQNVIAQLVTGPWTAWSEVAFSLYYLVLFFLSAVILYHYHFQKGSFSWETHHILKVDNI
ncbi:MAG: hypothetical protein ACLQU3_08045 [Limisphaerales bacterium]